MPRAAHWAIGLTLLAGLALAAVIGWRRTADLRAGLATRQTLQDLAVSIRLASTEPEPGLLPVNDAWGRPIELRPNPLARFLISTGADASPDTVDDVYLTLDHSALGDALEDNADLVRQGRPPDLALLEEAAAVSLSQEVRVEIGQSVLFLDASSEVLLEVEIDFAGRPIIEP